MRMGREKLAREKKISLLYKSSLRDGGGAESTRYLVVHSQRQPRDADRFMARAARDTRLETRTSRLKLAIGERYFLALSAGVSLRYRRTRSGYGVWALRCVDHEDKERLYTLGPADDHHEADGVRVLTFAQAQARCRELAHQMRATSTPTAARPQPVVQAAGHYLAWYR